MRALLIASLVVIGCGKVDPCANHSGVCFGLRIEGNVKNLDQLAVTVDKPQPKTVPTAVQPISLPVAVALDLPAGVSGSVHLSVVGLAHGVEVAAGATTASLSGNRGSATVTLTAVSGGVVPDLSTPPEGDMSGAGGDMTGIGGGSTDMAGCGMITACVNSDNCCPAGCNGTTDNDCPSVCGNNVVEPGEVCDDGNTTGGDGCDPTCRWREVLSNVSGFAAGFGHADGTPGVTRWSSPEAMAYDGTNLYVADNLDCTIRQLKASLGAPTSVTIAGSSWDCSTANGTLAQSRFSFVGSHADLAYVNGMLYESDPASGAIRKIDIAGNSVSNVVTGISPTGLGQYSTNLLVFYDSTAGTGGLKTYNTTSGAVSTVATIGAMTAAGVTDSSSTCHHSTCDATFCYVACERSIARVNMTMSNVAASYAGTYVAANGHFTLGCQGATAASNASAVFEYAAYLSRDSTGNLYVTDTACHEIVEVQASSSALYAGHAGGYGFVDGVSGANAYFDGPGGIIYVDNTDVYVADSSNGVVRNGNTFNVYTVSGTHHSGTEMLGANGTSTNFTTSAAGVASDGTYAYLLDPSGRLIKVTLASGAAAVVTLSSPAAWPDTNGFNGLLYWNGALYTTNSDGVIQTIHTDGTGAAVYAGTPGSTSPPSDGPRLTAVMNPRDLATDGTTLYFIDGQKQIRSVDAGGMVHSLAGMSGSTDYMDGTGTGAHLLRAQWLASDGQNLYFSDASVAGGQGGPAPSAVRRMSIAGNKVDTIAGSSSTNGHMDGAAASALFSGIGGLASDGLSLFIVDTETYNQQKLHIAPAIRQLDLKTMTVSTMIGTPGQQTFATGSGTSAQAHGPAYLTFDATLHALFFFDNSESVVGRIK